MLLLLQQLRLLNPCCYCPCGTVPVNEGEEKRQATPLATSLNPIIIINNYTKILLTLKTKKELRPLLLYSLPTRYYCSKKM